MNDNKGYYKTLGITDEDRKSLSSDALTEKIKKNFRKISLEHHPDKFANSDKSTRTQHEEVFKKANEAYTVLGDSEKRAQYDAEGQGFGGFNFGGWKGSSPFDNIFRERGFWGSDNYFKGEDVRIGITISLEEVLYGINRTFAINKDIRVSEGGRNKLVKKTFNTPIVLGKGAQDGSVIRLSGMGSECVLPEMPNGDLLIKITVKKHAEFERDGIDLYKDLEVNLLEAFDGTDKTVITLSGKKLNLKIPAMSPYGKLFRIPREGLPTNSSKIGDMYVRIKYKTPKMLTQRQVDLLREFYEIEENKKS